MINFGPATITWESLNVLSNGDFEVWSLGANNTPDNWTLSSGTIGRNSNSYTNNYSIQFTWNNNTNPIIQQAFHNSKGINYWKNKTITANGYGFANNANRLRIRLYDNNSTSYGNWHTGSNNWETLSLTKVISASATQLVIYAGIENNNVDTVARVDSLKVVEGPVSLGKTFGGGSIQLYEHKYTGVYSKNQTSLIYGGEGVIHMFQWNNSVPITADSTILDYGKITFTCNNMTITLDCCRLFLSGGMSLGQFTQQPFDLYFTFKKSPDTGNIITLS